MAAKTEKMPFFTIAGPKLTYVGKVPKIIFENLIEILINFEVFLVGKVPKSSVFNRDCLEKDYSWNQKNHETQKRVK